MKTFTVALILTVCLSTGVFSQAGQTGLTFLNIGVGARSIAMGETGVASARYGFGAYYNPAAMSQESRSSVSISHTQWIQDISLQHLGVVIPMSGWTFGGQVTLAGVEDIELRSRPGDPEGTFSSRDFSVGVSASMPVYESVSFGVTAKYLFEKIFVDVSDGYAFDFGIRAQPFDTGMFAPLRAGVSVSNLGSVSPMRNQEITLPANVRYGIAYESVLPVSDWTSTLEIGGLSFFTSGRTHINAGLEIVYSDLIHVRGGYVTNYEIRSVAVGIGFQYAPIRFDYALVPFEDNFGSTHTISLNIMF